MIIDIQQRLAERERSKPHLPRRPEGKVIEAAHRFGRRRDHLPPAA
jgi:hypothetical protein